MFEPKQIKAQLLEDSIVSALILPNISSTTRVLEIGCRQGQWTKYFTDTHEVIATDSNKKNVAFCKQQFAAFNHYRIEQLHNNDLSFIPAESIDFVWSFDTFTNFSPEKTYLYLKEICRVLTPQGKGIIHHPGYNNFAARCKRALSFALLTQKFFQVLSWQKPCSDNDVRFKISPEVFSSLALQANLIVEGHILRWGKFKQFSLKPYNDCLSIVTRNSKLLQLKF